MILNVACETQTRTETKYFKHHPVLEYKISYPQFRSNYFFKSTQNINRYYQNRADLFESYCRTVLYRMALESAEEAIKHDFPVMKFEANESFEVTYNENCALSLYTDRYLFTGGAHGVTERSADTWDLSGGGNQLKLEELFPPNYPVRKHIVQGVIGQINRQPERDTIYFEDYMQNVPETFRSENFYLTRPGLVIFFQQYDIAPYASGILTFLFPYQKNGPMPPKC